MTGSGDVYQITRGFALKATTTEIAVEHIRMAEVSNGGDNPGHDSAEFNVATLELGPSVIAHIIYLMQEHGMSYDGVMDAVNRELRELNA